MARETDHLRIKTEVDLKDLNKLENGLKSTQKEAEQTERKFSSMSSKVAGGFAAIAGAIGAAAVVDWAKSAINSLVEIEAQLKRAKTVFGDFTGDVKSAGKEIATSLGLTRREFLGTAAAVGDLLVPMGFTRKEAAGMSTDILELSGALKNFTGDSRSAADISEILAKAYLGERDALTGLGIKINEAEVQQRALAQTNKESADSLTQIDKALATQSLLFDRSKDAMNAFRDESDSLQKDVNKLSAVWGEFRELLLEFSSKILAPIVRGLVSLADGFNDLSKSSKTIILISSGLSVLLPLIAGLTVAMKALAVTAGLTWAAILGPITLIVAGLVAVTAAFVTFNEQAEAEKRVKEQAEWAKLAQNINKTAREKERFNELSNKYKNAEFLKKIGAENTALSDQIALLKAREQIREFGISLDFSGDSDSELNNRLGELAEFMREEERKLAEGRISQADRDRNINQAIVERRAINAEINRRANPEPEIRGRNFSYSGSSGSGSSEKIRLPSVDDTPFRQSLKDLEQWQSESTAIVEKAADNSIITEKEKQARILEIEKKAARERLKIVTEFAESAISNLDQTIQAAASGDTSGILRGAQGITGNVSNFLGTGSAAGGFLGGLSSVLGPAAAGVGLISGIIGRRDEKAAERAAEAARKQQQLIEEQIRATRLQIEATNQQVELQREMAQLERSRTDSIEKGIRLQMRLNDLTFSEEKAREENLKLLNEQIAVTGGQSLTSSGTSTAKVADLATRQGRENIDRAISNLSIITGESGLQAVEKSITNSIASGDFSGALATLDELESLITGNPVLNTGEMREIFGSVRQAINFQAQQLSTARSNVKSAEANLAATPADPFNMQPLIAAEERLFDAKKRLADVEGNLVGRVGISGTGKFFSDVQSELSDSGSGIDQYVGLLEEQKNLQQQIADNTEATAIELTGDRQRSFIDIGLLGRITGGSMGRLNVNPGALTLPDSVQSAISLSSAGGMSSDSTLQKLANLERLANDRNYLLALIADNTDGMSGRGEIVDRLFLQTQQNINQRQI